MVTNFSQSNNRFDEGSEARNHPVDSHNMAELAATLPKYPGAFYGTGFPRDYSKEAYVGYEKSGKIWFPVKFRTLGYHMKERVIGLEIKGKFKAYPLPNSQRVQVKSRIHWVEDVAHPL